MKNIILGIAMLPPVAIVCLAALYYAELYWYIVVPLAVYAVYRLERRNGVAQTRDIHSRAAGRPSRG